MMKKYEELKPEEKQLRRMSWRATALYLGTLLFGFFLGCIYTLLLIKGF